MGNRGYWLTGYLNIPKCLQLALYDGYDVMFKNRSDFAHRQAEDFKSYDELWNAFKTQLEAIIDVKMRGNLVIERIYFSDDAGSVPFHLYR